MHKAGQNQRTDLHSRNRICLVVLSRHKLTNLWPIKQSKDLAKWDEGAATHVQRMSAPPFLSATPSLTGAIRLLQKSLGTLLKTSKHIRISPPLHAHPCPLLCLLLALSPLSQGQGKLQRHSCLLQSSHAAVGLGTTTAGGSTGVGQVGGSPLSPPTLGGLSKLGEPTYPPIPTAATGCSQLNPTTEQPGWV